MSNLERYIQFKYGKDIFYLEDDILMKIMREWLGEKNEQN